jgi:hypothetical protein
MCRDCDVEFERLHQKAVANQPLSEMELEFAIHYIAEHPVYRQMLELMLGEAEMDPWMEEELVSCRSWEMD